MEVLQYSIGKGIETMKKICSCCKKKPVYKGVLCRECDTELMKENSQFDKFGWWSGNEDVKLAIRIEDSPLFKHIAYCDECGVEWKGVGK